MPHRSAAIFYWALYCARPVRRKISPIKCQSERVLFFFLLLLIIHFINAFNRLACCVHKDGTRLIFLPKTYTYILLYIWNEQNGCVLILFWCDVLLLLWFANKPNIFPQTLILYFFLSAIVSTFFYFSRTHLWETKQHTHTHYATHTYAE